jgi:hypothetical protein
MASTNAQRRLLDAAFEDFATSLVVSNILLPVSSYMKRNQPILARECLNARR